MSLSRTLNRLTRVVRAEARRNPEFADRLEAVLAAHTARRPQDQAEVAALLSFEEPAAIEPESAEVAVAPPLNPVALFTKEGADGLTAALSAAPWSRPALIALAREHNLDPAGEAESLDAGDLVAYLVSQAKKRVERDRRLFDY